MSIRVRIVDDEVLESISPENLSAHLHRTGWILGGVSSYGTYFYKDEYEIMVAERSARDFKNLMYMMFQVLEEVEDRSQLDIWEDLK